MSLREVLVWSAYRMKYGPMNDVRRHDRPAALLASLLSHAHGGKAEMKEFMPFGKEADETAATLDDIIAQIGGVKIGKRG